MPRDDVSDGALVEAHLTGDSQAFDTLFRRHHDRLVWFCWKRTHDHELAEDLAQEAMIRCLERAEMFDTSQPLWPWLQTVARNIVIDHYRRTKNDPHLDPDLGDDNDGSTATTTRLDRIEERSELGQVLARLPERQRIALRLHHGQDWTTADVADYLDIKTNACKQLLYRARNNARKYYEQVVDSTESALSIVFAHPVFLVLRERFQRSRTTIEALATDVASLTIALDAVAERAVAALAVVVTIALGGIQSSFALEQASETVSFDRSALRANGPRGADSEYSTIADTSAFDVRSPTQPSNRRMSERSVELSTDGAASVPASMSGSVTYDPSGSETKIQHEHDNSLSLGGETEITIECDGSGVSYDLACAAVGVVGDVLPDDADAQSGSDSDVGSITE